MSDGNASVGDHFATRGELQDVRNEFETRFDKLDGKVDAGFSSLNEGITQLSRQQAATSATKNTIPLGILASTVAVILAIGGTWGNMRFEPLERNQGRIEADLREFRQSEGHTASIREAAKNSVRWPQTLDALGRLADTDDAIVARFELWNQRQNDRQMELIKASEHIVPRAEIEAANRETLLAVDENKRDIAIANSKADAADTNSLLRHEAQQLQIESILARLERTESNRFTREDGKRLEDMIREISAEQRRRTERVYDGGG